MSAGIKVNEFRHIPGENDAEYAELLKEALDRQIKITQKAVAKVKELSKQIVDWIPCDKRMPEEHESIFYRWWGTEKWKSAMWRMQSEEVLVTVEFEDGARRTEVARTHDGKWLFDISIIKRKCVAWCPKPEPYQEG